MTDSHTDYFDRNQIDVVLQQAHRPLHALIQAAPAGIITLDRDGRITLWNPAAERIFGWSVHEVLGHLPPFVPEDKHEEFEMLRARVFQGETLTGVELPRQKKDGSPIDVSLSAAPLRDAEGDIGGIIAVVIDITERKREEEALQESEARFKDFFSHGPVGHHIFGPDRIITDINQAELDMIGFTRDEIVGKKTWADLIVPEERELFEQHWNDIMNKGAVRDQEYTLVHKQGHHVYVAVSATARFDREGQLINTRGMVIDVTGRRQAEDALQTKAGELAIKTERLEAMVKLSRTVTSTLDPQQVFNTIVDAVVRLLDVALARLWIEEESSGDLIRHASSGDSDLTDYPQTRLRPGEEMAGKALEKKEAISINHPAQDPRFLEKAWAQAKGIKAAAAVPLVAGDRTLGVLSALRRVDKPFSTDDLRLLTLFATQATIVVENARLYEEQHRAARQLEGTIEARTRELQAINIQLQEALLEAKEASLTKSRFLATMSHELRTPLNAIIGFSELLDDQQFGPLNARQQRYVGHVLTSGHHLLSLINDVLDLTKIEAEKLDLQLAPLSLPEVFKELLGALRPQIEAKRLGLRLSLEDCPTNFVADPVRFKQIVLNLLSNSVKFTPPGGILSVAARRIYGSQSTVHGPEATKHESSTANLKQPEDMVEIAVQDTGIGIKAEDLPRLFEEFTQLDASMSRRHEGTGLGLALTKRLVEMHGGTIQAHSAGEGRGSTFTVILPLDGTSAATPLS